MRATRFPFSALLLVGLVVVGSSSLTAGEWSQWRGQNRDGVVENFQAPVTWPDALTQVWRVEVGEGWSSPVLDNDRVFLLTRQGDEERVRCLELSTGELIWEARYTATGSVHPAGAAHGIGPKSTPAIAGGRLYTLGIGSILSCFDVKTGGLWWRKDFSEQFEKPAPSCGTSMSPLLVDGLCIVHVGVDAKGEMIAFDAETGSPRWTYDGDGPGYGSAVIATLNNNRQLVAPVSRFMVGLSLEDGSLLWRHPFPTQSSQNILTPVVKGEHLVVGGIGQTTAALRLSGSAPAMTVETVWKNPQAPLHMSSLILGGDRLFGLTSQKKGQLFCANAGSGETIWTGDGKFAEHVTLAVGGEHLIILTGDGELLFMRTDSDSFHPLATYRVSESRTWAHPLVSGKRIIIKDETSLACWQLGPDS